MAGEFKSIETAEPADTWKRRQSRSCLCCNRNVPVMARICIPICLVINMGCFVAGHLTNAASVSIILQLFGQQVRIDKLVGFSLALSLKQMADAGAWPLVILIGGFSGVWPYSKLFMIMACWVLPPSCLSVRTRGQMLLTLDSMGKWSLIDLYVLVMTMIGFRLHITNPKYAILPDNLWVIDTKVTPDIGIYTFCIAAVGALVINTIVTHYHRNAVASDMQHTIEHSVGEEHVSLEKTLKSAKSTRLSLDDIGTDLAMEPPSELNRTASSPDLNESVELAPSTITVSQQTTNESIEIGSSARQSLRGSAAGVWPYLTGTVATTKDATSVRWHSVICSLHMLPPCICCMLCLILLQLG
eukprot:COSAG01_NODE_772_length_13713_cov_71.721263_4_plen_357_part_00